MNFREDYKQGFKQQVLEKFAQDNTTTELTEEHRQKIDDFAEELFEKTSSLGSAAGTVGKSLGKSFLNKGTDVLTGAGSSIAVGAGMYGANKLYSSFRSGKNQEQYQRAVQTAVRKNPTLQQEYDSEEGRKKIMSYAATIFKFAPNVASDPNLLSSILSNAVQYDGIDSATLDHLTELEKRHNDLNSVDFRNFQGFK